MHHKGRFKKSEGGSCSDTIAPKLLRSLSGKREWDSSGRGLHIFDFCYFLYFDIPPTCLFDW